MELTGTSSIVTGGASGLGAATARRLAAKGSRVVLVDLDEPRGTKLAADLGGAFVRADVANPEEVSVAVSTATGLAPLRALVNCAGVGLAQRTVGRGNVPHDLSEFERILRVNLVGTFNCIRLAAAAMAETEPLAFGERGAVVNTSSVAGTDGQTGQAAYSASKGGIVGMTLPIARDLSAIGVRVNTIAPGLIDTPIYGTGPESDAIKAHLAESVLFPRRLGADAEFASMALELLSNSYMNGEVIRVDGGIRMPPK